MKKIVLSIGVIALFLVYKEKNKEDNYLTDDEKIKEKKILKIIKKLSEENRNWKVVDIKLRIEKIFYSVQESIECSEIEFVINYITGNFYNKQMLKFQWEAISKEKVTYKNIKIKDIVPVGLEENKNLGFNKITFKVIATGNKLVKEEKIDKIYIDNQGEKNIYQYWTLKLVENQWLLDEINNLEENLIEFPVISETINL